MSTISNNQIVLKWGIISAISNIIYITILYISGLWLFRFSDWFSYIILIASIIFSMKDFKRINNNSMSYNRGLWLGSLVSTISGIVFCGYKYIYTKLIDRNILKKVVELQESELEKRGMSEEQIGEIMRISQKFMNQELTLLISILSFIFIGVIFSLVISAFQKNT